MNYLLLITLITFAYDDAAPKPKHASVEELHQTLRAGSFKFTEDDVIKLIGMPTEMKKPGEARAVAQWFWNYDTHCVATFKEGKLTEVAASISPHLLVDRLTRDNFKRVHIGMTEQEVTDILGKATANARVGSSLLLSWGKTAQLTVSFNSKGLALGAGLSQTGYVALPPGMDIPVPGLEKK